MTYRLVASAFDDLPGWSKDDPGLALAPLQRCLRHLQTHKPYKTGSLGIRVDDFAEAFRALEAIQESGGGAVSGMARDFFQTHYVPCRIVENPGEGEGGVPTPGFVTGYYEPEIAVSRRPDAIWRFPFYRPPADLAKVTVDNAPHLFAAGLAFGRQDSDGMAAYADRAAIEAGHLAGRKLEIAWARDRVDVFFAHIQGSTRLIDRDGRVTRITYAAKSGHPFTPIGRLLVEQGELAGDSVTMASIRNWLGDNPRRLDEILHRNRSFIFFRECDIGLNSGPIGAAKVPLSAGRSLAVDRTIHTFATPLFIDAPDLTHLDDGRPFRRLMIAQDTGSAILGPARGDIFAGSGDRAGDRAGSVKHDATFFVLVPKSAADRLL